MAAAASGRLYVRVVPGARRGDGLERHGETWKVRVSARPERGAANDAVVRLLARTLDLPSGAVSLVAGHTARDKILRVEGISPAEIEARLAAAERKDGS